MSLHSAIIQKLLSTNAHIGRHVTSHHFKIFSAGTRNSLGITDADKTLISLRSACGFLSHLTRLKPDSRIMFVNTNPLYDEIILQTNKALGFKHDTTWRLGGFLTNSCSPRKFKGRNKKFNICAVLPPDCIVILDAEGKRSVINEANQLQIPVVGLVGSDVSWDVFRRITYPVPGNGDSVEFVYMFCNLIAKTVLKERKELRMDAKDEEEEVRPREDAEQDNKGDKVAKKFVFAYENLLPIPDDSSVTKQLLDKLVVLKYNGNTGADIGFNNGPRSVLEIAGGLTCLDLLINQIEALNAIHGCNIPLILVNEASAHNDIMKVLEKHPSNSIHSVLQCQGHIESDSDSSESEDEQDESDSLDLAKILLPLIGNKKLDMLLSQGKEYILMLGSDNLSHVVDTRILNHLIQNNVDFCLEMLPKPSEVEEDKFGRDEDIKILTPNKNWKFTDMMWMNINSVERQLSLKGKLSVSKHFAVSVPKSRYLLVQTTSDLLALQSDLYKLIDGAMVRNPGRVNPVDPSITLGTKFENVNNFRKRFKSIPSIVDLDTLKVIGDIWFGSNVTLKGKVSIIAEPDEKIVIPDGIVLENKIITRQADIDERRSL